MPPPGDRSALDSLVVEHLPAALRFATRLTGTVELAEEVVQEALFRAARGHASFRGNAQFKTWFFQIIIRAFRDHLRQTKQTNREQSAAELSEDLPDPKSPDPLSNAMSSELSQRIAQLISDLPPRQREVLVLTTYENLRASEVAQVLDISEANVHVNLHHARARLRTQLSRFLNDPHDVPDARST